MEYRINTKDWRTKNEKKTGLLKKIAIAGATMTASVIIAYGIVKGSDYLFTTKDYKTIKENGCEWVTKKATQEDVNLGYRGIADKIIENKNITLGRDVGINALDSYLKRENENKPLKKGEEFTTLDCNCNQEII